MLLADRGARAMLAAALTIVPAAAQAGGCSESSSSRSAPAGAGNPFLNICKAATKPPTGSYPGRGVVGGFVRVTCDKPADIYNLDVYLKWIVDPSDPTDSETVDHCYQYDADQLGTACTVASACKPGYWLITWSASVDIDGASASSSDSTHYHTVFTPADCKRIAG